MTDWLDKLRGTAVEVEAELPSRPVRAQTDGEEDSTSPRSSNLKSDEYVAYLNAMTSIRVIFNNGSEVVTMLTPTGLDEVLAARRAARRKN